MNEAPLDIGYDTTAGFSATTVEPPPILPVTVDNWAWSHDFIQSHLGSASQAPWVTSSANPPYTLDLHGLITYPRECLTVLQPINIVVKHSTHLLMQALRPYPLMMLRKETFPPFIHAHWHGQDAHALPEPILNCMSIAQMYVFRSEETKPFLWRTIKGEDERFLSQVTSSCF